MSSLCMQPGDRGIRLSRANEMFMCELRWLKWLLQRLLRSTGKRMMRSVRIGHGHWWREELNFVVVLIH